MNFENIATIKEDGFKGFYKIKNLKVNNISIPCERGVYMVLLTDEEQPTFLSIGSGGYFKKKNPNVPLEILNSKWVENAKVLYIGQAGGIRKGKWSNSTLCQRINDYITFGCGEDVAHYGGRFIWQIKNNQSLLMCWKTLPNKTIDPSSEEKKYLIQFKNEYSKLPFANLKLG